MTPERSTERSRKAADQGGADAQLFLAHMYNEGRGVPQNYAEAVRWYRKAADQGHPAAQYSLGVMYSEGKGIAKDDTEAVRWYRKAADQGHASARSVLDSRYAGDEVVTPEQSTERTRKAAEQGNANAQFILGFTYEHGEGVAQDYAEAVRWFRKAAEQGHPNAQSRLGYMYAQGEGVPQDGADSVRWYRKAADQGDAAAQYVLGVMCSQGAAPGAGAETKECREQKRKADEVISPVGDPGQAYRSGFMLNCERTETGHLSFRFDVKTSSEEWFYGDWFVPSTTDPETINWMVRFWDAAQRRDVLVEEAQLTISDFFREFNARVPMYAQVRYQQEEAFPDNLLPVDALQIEWSIASKRVKNALRSIMRFDDFCPLTPRRERSPKQYFVHRKGFVWTSPIAFKKGQWITLIDLEIDKRGLVIDEDCILQEQNEESRIISAAIQREVWRRDQGCCVRCGSVERLEFDHVIPVSMRGSNTVRNIQLLCEKCNRAKGGRLA